jgi:phenylacetate-CoA ligase
MKHAVAAEHTPGSGCYKNKAMLFSIILAGIKVYINPYLPCSWQNKMTERRVIKTIQDAYLNVPFYKQKYDGAGVDMSLVHRIDDLKLLPVLTKEEIRRNYPGNLVRRGADIEKCHKSATSGSSGQPLSFLISLSGYAYYLAESARIYSMIGYRPWHRSCYLRYAPLTLPELSASRQTFISSLSPVAEQIARLRQSKPDLIDAYSSTMLDIARHVTIEDLQYIKPRVITVNSEMSTRDEREYISGVFHCPVFDEYSTEETWGIAAECYKHNYHIFTDSVWVEFLDSQGKDAKPGELGDIVITTTRSSVMPFIRYAIGDRGKPSNRTCQCGYKMPLMESIEGRTDDWLVLPSGRLFEPSKVLCIVGKAIQQNPLLFEEYKIIQKKQDLIVLQYIRGRDFDTNLLNEIIAGISTLFDEPVVVLTEEVQPSRGIKRQALESRVRRNDNL